MYRPKLLCYVLGHKIRPRPPIYPGQIWKGRYCARCHSYPIQVLRPVTPDESLQ